MGTPVPAYPHTRKAPGGHVMATGNPAMSEEVYQRAQSVEAPRP
jgi:hypothetical protein